jgi:hypothetical protein
MNDPGHRHPVEEQDKQDHDPVPERKSTHEHTPPPSMNLVGFCASFRR